jgi:hypothetical protein
VVQLPRSRGRPQNWFEKMFADQNVEAKLIAAAFENDLS